MRMGDSHYLTYTAEAAQAVVHLWHYAPASVRLASQTALIGFSQHSVPMTSSSSSPRLGTMSPRCHTGSNLKSCQVEVPRYVPGSLKGEGAK